MSLDTILVAIGPDDRERMTRLAEETVDVAEPTGATVVLVHVFAEDEFDDAAEKLEFDPAREAVDPDAVARRYMTIHELVESFDRADVDYEAQGAVGERGDQIVRVAEEIDADRVFVGAEVAVPPGRPSSGASPSR